MTKYSWNQPICERCWILREYNWMPEGEIRLPVRVMDGTTEVHQCAYCGFPTFVGIFVRDDPDSVKFPREETDE